MESYGSYEVTREIASGPGRTVFGARKSGSDGYAVKFFPAASASGADLGGPGEEAAFGDARGSELQKQASASSRFVVPVIESGQDERGRWWVSKLYSRSVQKIIAGRVSLSFEDLFHLLHSVVLGTLDFKQACGRSHGNLKPSNIFLTGAPKVRESQVLLSDPRPANDAEAVACEQADLRAVGLLLYQLVRRREVDDAGDWLILPIESSREWTERFGAHTSQWLALCSRLLDPELARSNYSLEQLEKDLRLLKPKPAVSRAVLAASAAALVLGLAAILFLTRRQQFALLHITSDPPGALVQTNGVGLGPAPRDLKVPAGTSLRVSAEWRDAFGEARGKTNDELVVQNGQTHPISFRFPSGVLVLNSSPSGATVEINQTNAGVTPYRSPLLHAGTKLSYWVGNLPGYYSSSNTVTLLGGEQPQMVALVEQPKVQAGQAYVGFSSEPQRGADIFLDGKLFAKTTENKAVMEGTHEVKARFRDWPEKTIQLNVIAGQETNAHFYFEHNLVTLKSDPPGATVWLGAKRFGLTPTNSVLVQTGRFAFRFELDGHEVLTQTVDVADRKIAKEIPPIVAKLQPTNAAVMIKVTPEAAEVLDGVAGGRLAVADAGKPVSIVLKPGRHTLKVTALAPGYQTEAKEFDLASKARLSWEVELRKAEVPFTFSSDPPGAEFYGSDGKKFAATKVVWGKHTITARHPGHPNLEPVTREVMVARTGETAERFQFIYGTLVITSSPPQAAVFVKGTSQSLGVTPLTNRFLIGAMQYDLALAGVRKSVGARVVPGAIGFIGESFAERLPNSLDMPFVKVKEGFWVGKFEVSQKEYSQLMGKNPSPAPQDPDLPAMQVPWSQAMSFCRKLTQESREKSKLPAGWEFTLPTEKQWTEFAADALRNSALTVIKRKKAERIGSLKPDKLGLHDVVGNVWEWTLEKRLAGSSFSADVVDSNFPVIPAGDEEAPESDVGLRVILVEPGRAAGR